MDNVVIVLAKRTAIARYKKSFSNYNIVDICVELVKKSVSDKIISKIDNVVFGMVYQENKGQNVARQIALKSGISEKSNAYTVNMVCGSSLKALNLAYLEILNDYSKVALVGGLESMSSANYMLKDGLIDAISSNHMGITAENVAKKYGFKREELDEFAYNSTMKAINAYKNNKFDDEIVKVCDLKTDENIRFDQSMEKLSSLRPAFLENGVVTAGNSSSINDGASILVLMKESMAKELNLEILAYIKDFSFSGIDPEYMGLAPIESINKLLTKNNLKVDDIDLYEINEAFASQSLAIIKELNLDINKLNVNGGAIALGHPIGSSGSRIVVSLLNEMKKQKSSLGIASLCIGGGQAISLLVERK